MTVSCVPFQWCFVNYHSVPMCSDQTDLQTNVRIHCFAHATISYPWSFCYVCQPSLIQDIEQGWSCQVYLVGQPGRSVQHICSDMVIFKSTADTRAFRHTTHEAAVTATGTAESVSKLHVWAGLVKSQKSDWRITSDNLHLRVRQQSLGPSQQWQAYGHKLRQVRIQDYLVLLGCVLKRNTPMYSWSNINYL